MKSRLAVLISGRGTNFENIQKKIDLQELDAEIVCVLTNNKNAEGLKLARQLKIQDYVLDPENFSSNQTYEEEIVTILKALDVDWVILAGYMKLVKKTLLDAFPNKIINIHPSLLPAFKGLNAQKQAFEAGVKVAGCTVHYVNEKMDAGKIIAQKALNVAENETLESLSNRILQLEHDLYPKAIQQLISTTSH